MNVQAVMTPSPYFATPHATVAQVARIMAEHEIGAVPIVDSDNRVIGLLTDRDVCKVVGTMMGPATEVSALSLASKPVICCGSEEDLQSAMKTMRNRKIRRLPVVDKDGKLQGILSIDDVVLRSEDAREKSQSSVSFGDAVATLKAIYGNRSSRRAIVPA